MNNDCKCNKSNVLGLNHLRGNKLLSPKCGKPGIFFTTELIPASMGTSEAGQPFAPKNGAFYNTLVKYQADGGKFLYDSEGNYTELTGASVEEMREIISEAVDGLVTQEEVEALAEDLQDQLDTLEAQVEALATDFSYKGSVEDYEHLPANAATGDVYTTSDTGIIYVWDGNAWVALNKYPSVFTGTDGTTAGEEGLVPAPAAADAGKVLGADGNWVDNDEFYDVKINAVNGLRTDKTFAEIKAAWESGKVLRFSGTFDNLFWYDARPKGSTTTYPVPVVGDTRTLYTLQGDLNASGTGTPSILSLVLTRQSSNDSPMITATVPVVNLQPTGLDAAQPDYKIPSITVLKNALAEKEPVTIVGNGAPTTATEAVGIGQQYYDSTNSKLYYCSAITAQGTDPETYEYTWSSFGPNVVQTTGTSTTDVMSQDATTNMLWRDPTTKKTIQYCTYYYPNSWQGSDSSNIYLGSRLTLGTSSDNTLIGHVIGASSAGRSVAIGNNLGVKQDCVAIGYKTWVFGNARGDSSVSIGSDISSVPSMSIIIGSKAQIYGYAAPSTTDSGTITMGCSAQTAARSAIAIGHAAVASQQGEFNIGVSALSNNGSAQIAYGHNGSSYRLLSGVDTPQGNHDAATKEYVDVNTPTVFTTNEWNALWA